MPYSFLNFRDTDLALSININTLKTLNFERIESKKFFHLHKVCKKITENKNKLSIRGRQSNQEEYMTYRLSKK